MRFAHMRDLLEKNFSKKVIEGDQKLFTVEMDKDMFWQRYLNSFPEGTNPVYLTNTVHDCSCCRHFLKDIGATVWIDDELGVHTLFEFDTESPEEYQPVMDALDRFVKKCPINGAYYHYEQRVGCKTNLLMSGDAVSSFSHFYLDLPRSMIVGRDQILSVRGEFRTLKQVFKRSLDEISMDAVDTVLELIHSNSLYRGEEWLKQLERFKSFKEAYDRVSEGKKDLYCWKFADAAGPIIGHIRNHSIGTLLLDISEDVELDEAVRRYEAIVAPANYKRPKAIYTKKMLEAAQKKVEELGFMDSLGRRFATADDITVNNILFANRDTAKKLIGNVFDEMKEETAINPKAFSKVEEIPIDKFISDVLPTTKEIDVFMQSRLTPNLMSLIAPVNREAPSMFKWNNGFSWAYNGNMADSDIRQNVKNAGGNVDGVLRFSIQWNDGDDYDPNDEDAHCIEPNGNEIYYGQKLSRFTGGFLDVDIIHPDRNTPAVENIAWTDKSRMMEGTYQFYVHCYSNRGGKSGFRAEIEFNGNVYSFSYDEPLRQSERIYVAEVTLKNGEFSIREMLKSGVSSKEVWGIKTNTFVPVSMLMYSPNYWDEQNGNGNRHYLFMLKDCVNPDRPNGFYNEYLRNDLNEHKHVFEALGSKMSVSDDPNQLSGLGFSSTRRNELIVRVKGNTQRVMKIKF